MAAASWGSKPRASNAVLGALMLARDLFDERHRLAIAEYTHGPDAAPTKRLRAVVARAERAFDAVVSLLSPEELADFDQRCRKEWRKR